MSEMSLIIRAKDQASQAFDNVKGTASQAAQTIESRWKEVTAVTAGAALAVEGMARSQAEATEKTRRLAQGLGITEGEMRDLAVATSDVTLPLDEVLDMMEVGRQRGIDSAEGLQEFTQAWDFVGDATGENAVKLAESSAALRVLGIAAGEEAEAFDAFGYVTENTTTDVGEFMQIIERLGPELGELEMSIDDTAAIMGFLEQEMGLTGRVARQEFQQAVREADGSMDELRVQLGMSVEQFEKYRAEVEGSSEVLDRNAQIHADSYTPLQKLQHRVSELTYGFGGYIEQAAQVAPLMMAMGPTIKAVSLAKMGLAKASGVATVAVKALTAAKMFLLSPVFLVIAAITAAVAIGWYLHKNWDQVAAFLKNIWASFADFFQTQVIDRVTGAFQFAMSRAEEFKEHVVGIFHSIRDAIRGPVNAVVGFQNAIIGGFERLINAAGSAINSIPSISIPSWVPVIGGRSFGIPNIPSISLPRIPALARGGDITRGGYALVGEQGAEVVDLPTGSRVHPHGTGGDRSIYIENLIINASDGRRAGKEFVREVQRLGFKLSEVHS